MHRHFSREETGQAMVLVALALVAVLAMLALVLDGGYGYLQRRRMQNAADAAAFAGTRQLATRLDDTGATELAVLSAVNRYAELNGVPDSGGAAYDSVNANVRAYFVSSGNVVTGSMMGTNNGVPSGSVAVAVKVETTYETFIANVIGFPTFTASAIGQGRYGSLGAASDLVPIAVLQREYVFNQEYTLWTQGDAAGPFDFSVSQRGWVGLNGWCCSNSDIKAWMQFGYPGVVTVGQMLPGDSGTRASDIQIAEDLVLAAKARIGGTRTCVEDPGGVQCVIVPLYDLFTPTNGGKGDYRISGFAFFELTDAEPQGINKYIKGKFVQLLVSHGDMGGTGNTGLTTIKLWPPAALPPS